MLQRTGSLYNSYNLINKAFAINSTCYFTIEANNALLGFGCLLSRFDILNLNTSGQKYSTLQFFKKFNHLLFYFLIFWKRIIFRGKSFRVRLFKKKNKFILNFGYSHKTILKLFHQWAAARRKRKKERDRQRYVVYTNDPAVVKKFVLFFTNIKPYNCYTRRGLRFKVSPYGRRKGKLNQHVSILH